MKFKNLRESDDPFTIALPQIADPWRILLIRAAMDGVSRFEDFVDVCGARNILAERLKSMVDDGIMLKRPVSPNGRRFAYELTERGKAVAPIIAQIQAWADAPNSVCEAA